MTKSAIKACAAWLAYCLEIGWDKRQLNDLEALWWKHHDEHGNLLSNTEQKVQECDATESQSSTEDGPTIPSIAAGNQKPGDGWVSVEDALPENDIPVLVHQSNKFGSFPLAVGHVYGVKKKWRIFFDDDENVGHFASDYVTHWRKLPNPPNNSKQ